MPERVRPHRLCGPGAADDPPGAVPVQAVPVYGEEYRSFAALADGQVDGPCGARRERDGDDLTALTGDDQGPVAALDAEGLDVRAGGLGDPQAVDGQQGDQGMLGGRAEPGGDQQCADLVAVQAGCMRLVVQARPADMHCRGMIPKFLLDGVPVEPRYRAQPPGDGGPGAAVGLEVTGEALNVGAADAE